MPRPSPSAYRAAQLRARALAGQLQHDQARRILAALRQLGLGLERRLVADLGDLTISGLASTRALSRSEQIVRQLYRRLLRELTLSMANGRVLTFDRVLALWDEAGQAAAASVGVAGAVGEVAAPALTMLNAFEAVGGGATWRTLLRDHVGRAATEANRIVRLGMLEGIGPDELGRRLRRYVAGVEGFEPLFRDVTTLTGEVAKIDLREVPQAVRGAAKRMRSNANRIAFSELHNARHEAEVQHMLADPLVGGVRWRLSPDRGSGGPDECDVLASTDFFGLGAGVYPVERVPGPPHPYDRCELQPVTRSTRDMRQPKRSPPLRVSPSEVPVPQGVSNVDRVRAQVRGALAFGARAVREAA